ncbi:MAG: 1-deoxy-D-xylulose-5-phosphate synthase, partial [Chthonomonadales bacterium]|nr:1-deoxy-D-xylulose-5-phosphate synthase [Chthonomonadales bacterium]
LAKLRTSGWYQDLERRTADVLKRLPAGDVAARAAGGLLKHSVTNIVAPEQTGVVFEQMGFEYIGPLDGHDIPLMVDVFRQVKQMKGPVLVHLSTTKGKGCEFAENNARKYHAVTPFEPATGEALKASSGATYTSVFAETLVELAEADDKIVGITAAMPDGTGINKLQERFPERAFDTGIAEEHAVCFAAGLAAAGMRPVVAIYSTFLQRAYDMIIHDVALQRLPVIFALDRAGLVGEDGGTHHGAFDLTYLRSVPGMVVMAPRNGAELASMLRFAHEHVRSRSASPVAIRYPRGAVSPAADERLEPIRLGRAEALASGDDVAFIAIGSMVEPACEAARVLREEGIEAAVVNARFAKPLDREVICSVARRTGRLVVCEENSTAGGFGAAVLEALATEGITGVDVRLFGIPDRFIEHGSQATLRSICHLTAGDFAAAARDMLGAPTPARVGAN